VPLERARAAPQSEPTEIDETESAPFTPTSLRAGKPFADSLEPSKPNSVANVPISNQIPMNLIQEEDPDIDRCDDELNDREPP
jgi:hypothetical protein